MQAGDLEDALGVFTQPGDGHAAPHGRETPLHVDQLGEKDAVKAQRIVGTQHHHQLAAADFVQQSRDVRAEFLQSGLVELPLEQLHAVNVAVIVNTRFV